MDFLVVLGYTVVNIGLAYGRILFYAARRSDFVRIDVTR